MRGYETLPGKRPDTLMPPFRPDPWRGTDGLRGLLAGRGQSEVVTFALISPQEHERLGIPAGDPRTVRAANPVSTDHMELRRSLLPGLLRVLADNERQRREDVQVFELGSVHAIEGARSACSLRRCRAPAGCRSPGSRGERPRRAAHCHPVG